MEAAVERGDVVVIQFPFSDLTDHKRRPALVLAVLDRGDVKLAQITSKPYADPIAVEIRETDFEQGNLPATSYIRPGKLFTASSSLIEDVRGRLKQSAHQHVVGAITDLLAGRPSRFLGLDTFVLHAQAGGPQQAGVVAEGGFAERERIEVVGGQVGLEDLLYAGLDELPTG